ncbi:MAG: hypothetical protein L3J39_18890 [Verrucomicrobiales bacterium]|nr:hypothetical protein [Verrucomicrobiales bacterium]
MTLIITLILIGTIALLLELFLPGGIVGAVGALCLLAAIVVTFNRYGVNAGILTSLAILILSCIALYYWMKNFEKLPGMKRFILTQSSEQSSLSADRQSLLNQSGRTLTDLGPSGKAMIDGKKLDVVAQSGYIDRDTSVTVIKANGHQIIVRAESL